jgi:hypothetical protein
MDKIFDSEIKEYLIELGIEEEQVENLRKKKLKEYSIYVLNKVIEAIESNNIDLIEKYLDFSPAGDDMGRENTFIDFGGISGYRLDIRELFEWLNSQKSEEE